MTCPAPRHGTALAYQVDRCRCPEAREAQRLYRKRCRTGRQPAGRVDATGTARRLQALAAIGWPATELASRLGYTPRQARTRIADLRHPTGRAYRTTAEAVARLYNELSGTPGPSSSARIRAHRAGWAPPLLWDGINIDDPAARPAVDEPAPTPAQPAKVVDLDEITYLNLTVEEAAVLYRVDAESIRQARRRQARRVERAQLDGVAA
jgi:hypothetical protein